MFHIESASFLFPVTLHLNKESGLKVGLAFFCSCLKSVRTLPNGVAPFYTRGSQTRCPIRITRGCFKIYWCLGPTSLHSMCASACMCVCGIPSKCSKWANYANWLHYKVMHFHLSWALNLNPVLHLQSLSFPFFPGTFPNPFQISLVLHLPHPYLYRVYTQIAPSWVGFLLISLTQQTWVYHFEFLLLSILYLIWYGDISLRILIDLLGILFRTMLWATVYNLLASLIELSR